MKTMQLKSLKDQLARKGVSNPEGETGQVTSLTDDLLAQVAGAGFFLLDENQPFCQFRSYEAFDQIVA